MTRRDLSRRMVLRGAAGAAVALPLLNDWVGRARAAVTVPPKRFIMFFTPNGTIPNNWFPIGGSTGVQTDFQLRPIMTPFAPHKENLVLFRNVDDVAGYRSPYGDAHGLGIGCLFTGIEPQPGNMFEAGMGGPGSGWPNGPTIDQLIAQNLPMGATKFPSLEYSIKTMAATIFSRISYRKAADPVTPESDPGKAFDRLFSDVTTDTTTLQRLRRRRKSILDDVSSQLDALLPKVSPTDRTKIQAHVNSIRELETRLPTPGNGGSIIGGNCRLLTRSNLGSGNEVKANASGMEIINGTHDVDVPQRNQVFRELMVMALACDLTRVISFQFAPSRSDIIFQWLGHTDSHHNYSHQDTNAATPQLTAILTWYSQRIADIIADLKAIPEGAGNAFSNTIMLNANELGVGQSHIRSQIPIMVIAGPDSAIKTGQYFNFPTIRAQNDILITIAQAMGLSNVTTFGNPAYCTGPIAGMLK